MKTAITKLSRQLLLTFSIFFFLLIQLNDLVAQEVESDIEITSGENYIINVKYEDNLYTIKLEKSGNYIGEPLILTKLTSAKLFNFVSKTYTDETGSALTGANLNNFKKRTDLAFIELMAALYNTTVEGQKIATIELKESVNVYERERITKEDRKKLPKGNRPKSKLNTLKKYEVSHCQLVFEDGFIKSILVHGKYDGKEIIFSNSYAIGISTRTNIQRLIETALFNERNKNDGRFIIVGELLDYTRILSVRTNDFSPADNTIVLYPDKKESLSKSPSSELFELNIFSDFVGFNENKPNGLIQTEFSKRINFWTKRTASKYFSRLGVGAFTHVIPTFELSKIEENNRLMPISISEIDGKQTFYISPLEAYRYSAIKVATEVNILDAQGSSASIHLNGFVGLNVTYVQDTIVEDNIPVYYDETINSVSLGAIVKVIFEPESRWSYKITDKVMYNENLNNKFKYYSPIKDGLEKPNEVINTAEFLISWNTGSDNKLFGRFRFNHELVNWENNFSEFQVGYSISFKSSKKK